MKIITSQPGHFTRSTAKETKPTKSVVKKQVVQKMQGRGRKSVPSCEISNRRPHISTPLKTGPHVPSARILEINVQPSTNAARVSQISTSLAKKKNEEPPVG
jgi:hypothetical protein